MYFFFFKQKTAYEMRISDWSSDVCSSDLPTALARASDGIELYGSGSSWARIDPRTPAIASVAASRQSDHSSPAGVIAFATSSMIASFSVNATRITASITRAILKLPRSEEHTSELQSLMRISYAVFCLKKKKKQ